jgi:hypothetical protein
MLKLHHVILALALLFAMLGDSWSRSQHHPRHIGQNPIPPPSQSTQPNNSTTTDQRGTEQSPLIVKVLPPANRDDESNPKSKSEAETTTHYLVGATIALAVIGFLQLLVFGWQGIQLGRTVKATKEAAHAAGLSARAAIAIDLPIIRIDPDSLHYGKDRDGQNPETYYCSIRCLDFSNLGRTKAFPIEVQCGWFIGTKLPAEPTYIFTKPFPLGAIFEPEQDTIRELNIFEFMFETKPGLYDRLRDKTESLWFFCSFAYLDFMKNRHDEGFCWERYETFGTGGFRRDPTPAYNRKT